MTFEPGQHTLVPLITAQAIPTSESATTLTSAVVDGRDYVGKTAGFIFNGGSTVTGTLVSTIQTSAEPRVQKTLNGADTVDVVLRNGASDNLTVGLKFSPSYNCTMKDCWLKLKSAGTIASGKYLKLEIQTDSSGTPSDTAIATAATIAPHTLATTYSFIQFSFATPIDLSTSSTYHFVLSGDYSASSSNHVKISSTTVASGGTLSLYDSGWGAVATNSPNVWATGYTWTDANGVTQTTSAATSKVEFNSDGVGRYYRGKIVLTPADANSNRVAGVAMLATPASGMT